MEFSKGFFRRSPCGSICLDVSDDVYPLPLCHGSTSADLGNLGVFVILEGQNRGAKSQLLLWCSDELFILFPHWRGNWDIFFSLQAVMIQAEKIESQRAFS